ncbi:MAG: helix-turn-helix domain-containing protein [Clostridiales bacterium]|nr:helix-turn-helix domain-containing protein [Clostridiales bacterium]
MIDREKTGRRLSALRRAAGLTQAALAKRLCVSTQAVSKWETGGSVPDVALLLELSALYGVTVNALLGEETSGGCIYDGAHRELAALRGLRTEGELSELSRMRDAGTLELSVRVTAKTRGNVRETEVPVESLSDAALYDLAPALSETLGTALGEVDRGLRRMLPVMRCPKCGGALSIAYRDGEPYVACAGGHTFPITDGVLDFGTREIRGELWSLFLKNYEQYRTEIDRRNVNPNYLRGLPHDEAYFAVLARRKPRVILDIASGAATGVGMYYRRIDWPCTIILTDVSHRILKYDRIYYNEDCRNPYVDVMCIACDCAALPFTDESVDCVTSLAGFGSMQEKWMDGFREAYRVLKSDGAAVYDMSILTDPGKAEKWIRLLAQDPDFAAMRFDKMMLTREQWEEICREIGFRETAGTLLYEQLPEPEGDAFPYENEAMQWMGEMICESVR